MEDSVVELWKGGDPESSESGGHTRTDEQLTLLWNNNITGSTSNIPSQEVDLLSAPDSRVGYEKPGSPRVCQELWVEDLESKL